MIVFYVNFDDWRLATMAFVSLSLYGYVTVRVTLWRKKFRQATNKHDNDYHDKATDRWVNETPQHSTRDCDHHTGLSVIEHDDEYHDKAADRRVNGTLHHTGR